MFESRGTNVSALTANASGLTGGTSPAVTVLVQASGGATGRLQQVTDLRGID